MKENIFYAFLFIVISLIGIFSSYLLSDGRDMVGMSIRSVDNTGQTCTAYITNVCGCYVPYGVDGECWHDDTEANCYSLGRLETCTLDEECDCVVSYR